MQYVSYDGSFLKLGGFTEVWSNSLAERQSRPQRYSTKQFLKISIFRLLFLHEMFIFFSRNNIWETFKSCAA